MDQAAKHDDAPPEWIEALEVSRAQLAAGRTVPLDDVLKPLQESIERLEAKLQPHHSG